MATLCTSLILSGCFLAAWPAVSAAGPIADFSLAANAMISAYRPDSDYADLQADGRVPADRLRADAQDPALRGGPTAVLLRFDDLIGGGAGQVPPGATVYQALLRLTTSRPGEGAALHRMLVDWSADATWNSLGNGIQADGVEAEVQPDLITGAIGAGVVELDVTDSVQAWAQGASNYGWGLLPSGPDGWDFWSSSAADESQRPRLFVLYGAGEPNLSIASGDVTSDGVVLWAQATVPGIVTFELSFDENSAEVFATFGVSVSDALVPAKLEVPLPAAGTRYYFRATDAAGVSRIGTFRSAAAAGQPHGLRFAVTGDWRGELSPYPAIANVPGRELDFYVALGDTIYADVASPAVPKDQCETLEEFRLKHEETYAERFGQASNADVRASTPWFSMIDDHEVTNDFAGGAPPASDPRFKDYPGDYINETDLFARGLQAFHDYQPIRDEFYGDTADPRTAFKRKLYRERSFGDDAAMILSDARSFRDEEIADVFEIGADQWFQDAFEPGRTMLGEAQLQDVQNALLDADAAGITWKFILIPEPIQNLGPILGEDRYEGYAWERTRLLQFIDEHDLRNVVFIAADIHCTIVNNLSYQLEPQGENIALDSWEISTGSVAYAPPFGPVVIDLFAEVLPNLGGVLQDIYYHLDRAGQDELLIRVIDVLLSVWSYDPIGLDGSGLPATLLQGKWVSLNTFGWSEFEIDAQTQQLRVTTYGIDWYDEDELLGNPLDVVGRTPVVVSEFVVDAVGP